MDKIEANESYNEEEFSISPEWKKWMIGYFYGWHGLDEPVSKNGQAD